MRIVKWIGLGAGLALTVWACAGLLPGGAPRLSDGPFRTRFGNYPPEHGFRFVFARPVPQGVTELACAGETWLQGTNVWLTFRAPPEVTRELLKNWTVTHSWRADEQRAFREMWDSTLKRYDPKNKLRWDEVYQGPRTQCFDATHAGAGRELGAWIDEERGRVYVFLSGP